MNNFIDDYLLLTEGNKSPREYHIWCMLYTLSVFAGRRFFYQLGPYKYYPNLYVILVGDPGIAKTSAMDRSLDIVRESGICPVSGTKITKEKVVQKMGSDKFEGRRYVNLNGHQQEYNQFALYCSELVDFLGAEPQGYLDFFTACWDRPVYDSDTKNAGTDVIVGPYITLLGCMTPEKLKGYMKTSVLTGGFARRCGFVFSATRKSVARPTFTPEQQAAKTRCIAYGKALQGLSGEFKLTPECDKLYDEWHDENERLYTDRLPCMKGWYESKGEMLFKLSMLIALGTTRTLEIDVPHYRLALSFCSILEATLPRVFEGAGLNPNAGVASQISRMLEALDKPMPRKKLEAMFYSEATSLNELRDLLGHLVSVGRLSEKNITVNGTFLGTVIGTPSAMAKYSDAALAVFLGYGVEPETKTSLDQNPSDYLATLPSTWTSEKPPDEPQIDSEFGFDTGA